LVSDQLARFMAITYFPEKFRAKRRGLMGMVTP
jgi:hypothetical protein